MQQITTASNREMCQDDDKTPRLHVRSGMQTVAYWRDRLFKNTYRDRKGTTVELPEYYVRLTYGGTTKRIRLTHADRERAAEEALGLFRRLQKDGWGPVDARKAHVVGAQTIEQFCDSYLEATSSMQKPPRAISISTYCYSLKQLCRLAGVTKINALSPGAVELARDRYRAEARKRGRQDSAINNTLTKIIRNAASCFSREALAIMKRRGLNLENPFAEIRAVQEIQPVVPLRANVIDRIWQDASMLRDGDPAARDPNHAGFRATYRALHNGRKPRWKPIDFRSPRPRAYAALLLGLGVGLRANEIDKARWRWLYRDQVGQCFVEVQEEHDFKPKGGKLRLIKIPTALFDELMRLKENETEEYLIGGGPKPPPKNPATPQSYRRPDVFHAVNAWLRARGVEEGKSRGNPLHRLRKQFGSELATRYGLFAAQKLLGHSSPATTSRYYAAQTELPELTHIRLLA